MRLTFLTYRMPALAFASALVGLSGCTSDVTLSDDTGGAGGSTTLNGGQGGSGNSGGQNGGQGGLGASGADGGAGNTGNTGNTGGDGPVPLPECDTNEDCVLVNDCCSCEGVAVGDAERCLATCIQPACEALGHSPAEAQCIGGTCVAGFDCTSPVVCAQPEPQCPLGQVALRTQGCWGGCVPATECASVESCETCNGPSQTCVEYVSLSTQVNCFPVADNCEGGTADCACAGEIHCSTPYDACFDTDGGVLTCECTNC